MAPLFSCRSKVRRSSMAFQEAAAFQNDSVLSLRNRIPTWNSVKLDIKSAICDKYGLDDASVIHIAKRNKKLECGDFLVVIPSMKKSYPVQTQTQSQTLRNQLRHVQQSKSCDEVNATTAVETPMPCVVGIAPLTMRALSYRLTAPLLDSPLRLRLSAPLQIRPLRLRLRLSAPL